MGESGGMKIFADYHHGGLYHSLQLMADDLGAEIYRPVGMDWFNNGYFGIAEPYGNAIETVRQFLEFDSVPMHDLVPSINYGSLRTDSVFVANDIAHESRTYAISFETFANTDFDVIICTIPYDLEKFYGLRNTFQPRAKLIYQIGNPGWSLPEIGKYPNILDSVGMIRDEQRRAYNYLRYHQKFEEEVFYPGEPTDSKNVTSMILFPEQHHLFEAAKQLLPDYNFVSYGYSPPCDHPQITGISNIAKIMHDSRFGWHYKTVDGYGHIIHNWFACGRPVIASYEAYRDRQARDLLVDEETGCNLDGRNIEWIVDFIRRAENPEFYQYLCKQTQLRYKMYVDFEREAKQIRHFFETLI